ncbi:MAG: hypothetical protein FH749_06510 [Firmicutes bacterium]|nr:hypothetical protein [Bacillota bacterium]
MRPERIHLLRGASARRMAEKARVPLGTISPLLRSMYYQWDSEYCLQLMLARFGEPSYRLRFRDKSEAWTWVLWSRRPENVIVVEIWPQNLPQGFYLHCRNWNSVVVEFCLWLTRGHLHRQLYPAWEG